MQAFPRSVRIFSLSGALRGPCSQSNAVTAILHEHLAQALCASDVCMMITEVFATEAGAPSVQDLLSSGSKVLLAVASCL